MRFSAILATFGLLLTLGACGGGGGGGGGGNNQSSANTGNAPPSTPPSQQTADNTPAQQNLVTQSTTPNVLAVTVDGGPSNIVNMLFATVTICAPGSATNCQSIDHVLVDTGSTGLRLLSSELNASLILPPVAAPDGNTLTECMQFADGYTWGPLKKADVKLAGEVASSIPIQIIADSNFPSAPLACQNKGNDHQTLATLSAKGILGIGMFNEDCGAGCAISTGGDVYFSCTGISCTPSLAPVSQQTQNPVAHFATDNNGVLLKLPAIPSNGSSALYGSLIFGIGSQANNNLGAASVYLANPNNGYITTVYNGTTFSKGFIDSGSNGTFFHDTSINKCASGFYCPGSPQVLTATNRGMFGTPNTVTFTIANADALVTNNPTHIAFDALGGDFPYTSSFDWGLSFFYGRNVFTAIDGKMTPGGTGPYFAY